MAVPCPLPGTSLGPRRREGLLLLAGRRADRRLPGPLPGLAREVREGLHAPRPQAPDCHDLAVLALRVAHGLRCRIPRVEAARAGRGDCLLDLHLLLGGCHRVFGALDVEGDLARLRGWPWPLQLLLLRRLFSRGPCSNGRCCLCGGCRTTSCSSCRGRLGWRLLNPIGRRPGYKCRSGHGHRDVGGHCVHCPACAVQRGDRRIQRWVGHFGQLRCHCARGDGLVDGRNQCQSWSL
mmetsp:Transcript_57997/g.186308  ORF Transcript_57997/g.186308 Transcript_57997/m.186308 type:complete len:236 (+) Transcript_57997:316-1023(+)